NTLVAHQFEPFASAAANVDHDTTNRRMGGARVRQVSSKTLANLVARATKSFLKCGIQPRRGVVVPRAREVRNGGRQARQYHAEFRLPRVEVPLSYAQISERMVELALRVVRRLQRRGQCLLREDELLLLCGGV